MTNWLKTFLPRKYAVIDGRQVTEPIINRSDTTFTVTGNSNWGSTSKYNVHLQGPNSYYLYKTLSGPQDDPSAGGARQEQITVTGNEPERLNRYRGYINSLAPEDYKYWWQQIFSKADGGKVEKGEDGLKTEKKQPDYTKYQLVKAKRTYPFGTKREAEFTDGRGFTYLVQDDNNRKGQLLTRTEQGFWPDGNTGRRIYTEFDPKTGLVLKSDTAYIFYNSDGHPAVDLHKGMPGYELARDIYNSRLGYTNLYSQSSESLYKQKSGGKLYNEDLITAIQACGGKVLRAEKGTKTHTYSAISRHEQDIPEETLIDRTGKHPRYTYVPGELKSHRFALDTKKVIPNLDRLMKPGEQRMYIDPTTNRILTYTGPVDPNISSVRYIEGNIGRSSTADAMYQFPGQDIYLFPDGQVYRNVREQSNRNWLETLPQESIPINQNDNTSTDGSNNPNPIKGIPGLKPVESIQRPEGYNPDEDWMEEKDSVNGGVRKTWKNKKTGRITRINPNKVQKGQDGMITSEFPPTWNQGEIRQGFQKSHPDWMKKFDSWADRVSGDLNNPQKSGPLAWFVAPAFDYLTSRPGNIGYAAILPGAGPLNSASKAAVGKSAKFEKQLAERAAQVALQRAKDLEISTLRKKALSMTDAELDKAIENAFKAKGLKEQMAKWDQELITNADRNIINPSWLDELTASNTQYIKEIDPNLISGSTKPPLLGALMLGSGVGTVGGGFYLMTKGKTKKKEAEKAKAEEKACGGKMKKKK